MKKTKQDSKQGFTIIEVVLVLAIAGLIFLMVFVALPALQRSQRDTQRRNDMARLITAVQNYQSANKNKVPIQTTSGSTTPTLASDFVSGYLTNNGDTFSDPSTGETYTFAGIKVCASGDGNCANASTSAQLGVIQAYTNAKCDGAGPAYVQGANKVAFTIKLEGSGTYCTNN